MYTACLDDRRDQSPNAATSQHRDFEIRVSHRWDPPLSIRDWLAPCPNACAEYRIIISNIVQYRTVAFPEWLSQEMGKTPGEKKGTALSHPCGNPRLRRPPPRSRYAGASATVISRPSSSDRWPALQDGDDPPFHPAGPRILRRRGACPGTSAIRYRYRSARSGSTLRRPFFP